MLSNLSFSPANLLQANTITHRFNANAQGIGVESDQQHSKVKEFFQKYMDSNTNVENSEKNTDFKNFLTRQWIERQLYGKLDSQSNADLTCGTYDKNKKDTIAKNNSNNNSAKTDHSEKINAPDSRNGYTNSNSKTNTLDNQLTKKISHSTCPAGSEMSRYTKYHMQEVDANQKIDGNDGISIGSRTHVSRNNIRKQNPVDFFETKNDQLMACVQYVILARDSADSRVTHVSVQMPDALLEATRLSIEKKHHNVFSVTFNTNNSESAQWLKKHKAKIKEQLEQKTKCTYEIDIKEILI